MESTNIMLNALLDGIKTSRENTPHSNTLENSVDKRLKNIEDTFVNPSQSKFVKVLLENSKKQQDVVKDVIKSVLHNTSTLSENNKDNDTSSSNNTVPVNVNHEKDILTKIFNIFDKQIVKTEKRVDNIQDKKIETQESNFLAKVFNIFDKKEHKNKETRPSNTDIKDKASVNYEKDTLTKLFNIFDKKDKKVSDVIDARKNTIDTVAKTNNTTDTGAQQELFKKDDIGTSILKVLEDIRSELRKSYKQSTDLMSSSKGVVGGLPGGGGGGGPGAAEAALGFLGLGKLKDKWSNWRAGKKASKEAVGESVAKTEGEAAAEAVAKTESKGAAEAVGESVAKTEGKGAIGGVKNILKDIKIHPKGKIAALALAGVYAGKKIWDFAKQKDPDWRETLPVPSKRISAEHEEPQKSAAVSVGVNEAASTPSELKSTPVPSAESSPTGSESSTLIGDMATTGAMVAGTHVAIGAGVKGVKTLLGKKTAEKVVSQVSTKTARMLPAGIGSVVGGGISAYFAKQEMDEVDKSLEQGNITRFRANKLKNQIISKVVGGVTADLATSLASTATGAGALASGVAGAAASVAGEKAGEELSGKLEKYKHALVGMSEKDKKEAAEEYPELLKIQKAIDTKKLDKPKALEQIQEISKSKGNNAEEFIETGKAYLGLNDAELTKIELKADTHRLAATARSYRPSVLAAKAFAGGLNLIGANKKAEKVSKWVEDYRDAVVNDEDEGLKVKLQGTDKMMKERQEELKGKDINKEQVATRPAGNPAVAKARKDQSIINDWIKKGYRSTNDIPKEELDAYVKEFAPTSLPPAYAEASVMKSLSINLRARGAKSDTGSSTTIVERDIETGKAKAKAKAAPVDSKAPAITPEPIKAAVSAATETPTIGERSSKKQKIENEWIKKEYRSTNDIPQEELDAYVKEFAPTSMAPAYAKASVMKSLSRNLSVKSTDTEPAENVKSKGVESSDEIESSSSSKPIAPASEAVTGVSQGTKALQQLADSIGTSNSNDKDLARSILKMSEALVQANLMQSPPVELTNIINNNNNEKFDMVGYFKSSNSQISNVRREFAI